MADASDAKKLVQDEEKESGSVKWSVYLTYFAAAGLVSFVFVTLAFVLNNLLTVASDA